MSHPQLGRHPNVVPDNPLRYNCDKEGVCFNLLHRPGLEWINPALPGTACFSDIDGCAEIHGYFLELEFKTSGVKISKGQGQMLRRKTMFGPATAILLTGQPHQMLIETMQVIKRGRLGHVQPATLDDLYDFVEEWGKEALNAPLPKEYEWPEDLKYM